MRKWPHFTTGIAYEWRRIRAQGKSILVLKFARHLASTLLWFLMLPMAIVFHLAGYRRVTVFTDRIGHLALEPDCLLKEQALGLIPNRRWIILAPPERVANHHLLNYWKPFIRIFEGTFSCFIIESMSRWGVMRQDVSRYILSAQKAQDAYSIYEKWGGRPPMLSLTAADMEWGEMALRRLGIPKGGWFVCVHVRESGFSPIDEELHLHRNGSIENVIPALKEITNRGGWVIRIGDPTMTPLPPIPQTIDYAHHAMKSERLDVILCARSRFILGCTSGISIVGSVFGIPCAIANMIPVLDLWFNSKDISIPKLLWLEKNGRYIRLDEATASHVSKYRYASLYRDAGIRVEENSAEDILDLTIEMFDRLEGKFMILDSDEELLSCFLSLIEKDHYAFGSCAVISTVFLRKHASLLPHPPLSN